MGARHDSWMAVRFLLRIRYLSMGRIGNIHVPILIIHGRDDELISYTHGEQLFAVAAHPKTLLRMHGTHNGGAT